MGAAADGLEAVSSQERNESKGKALWRVAVPEGADEWNGVAAQDSTSSCIQQSGLMRSSIGLPSVDKPDVQSPLLTHYVDTPIQWHRAF